MVYVTGPNGSSVTDVTVMWHRGLVFVAVLTGRTSPGVGRHALVTSVRPLRVFRVVSFEATGRRVTVALSASIARAVWRVKITGLGLLGREPIAGSWCAATRRSAQDGLPRVPAHPM